MRCKALTLITSAKQTLLNMRIETFNDASEFLAATDQFLLADEANNNLLLSLALMLVQSPLTGPTLYAAFYDQGLCGALIWISGRKIVATACPTNGVDLLIKEVVKFQNARES